MSDKKINENKRKKESLTLRFLYKTAVGRILLKPLTSSGVSKISGRFMDSRLSKPLIRGFVRKNGINLDDFYSDSFSCFNDCFTRKIREEKRPIDMSPEAFISPCDALLSVYLIDEDTKLDIKGSVYSVESLVCNKDIARKYIGGYCLVFRLCVHHYHRYIYLDGGSKSENIFIKGKLHTVRPIALETYPIFKQNCREVTVLHTENFGDVTQIEVGAMLVGKIKNHHGAAEFKRGDEKGMFLYGGSTIVLLVEGDRVKPDGSFKEATSRGEEIEVKMGERLGCRQTKPSR